MATQELDQSRVDAFAERMLGVLNHGALALMISVGHRTRLFDTMAGLPAATSQQIADAAGLNERYVREWLGSMVAGGVVRYDPATTQYTLPPEHAACLTRAASPNNMAATAQWLPLLGMVEDQIVERFAAGGGVPYSCYPRFHQVMAEESGQTVVEGLFDRSLPLAPGLIERLAEGIDVLDVGCGSGRAVIRLAREFPRSRFAGYDFSAEGSRLPVRPPARRAWRMPASRSATPPASASVISTT
jgi:hypothetical protein